VGGTFETAINVHGATSKKRASFIDVDMRKRTLHGVQVRCQVLPHGCDRFKVTSLMHVSTHYLDLCNCVRNVS
jgi:hypothetical protein